MTMKGRKTIKKPSFLIQYLGSLLLVAAFLILTGVIVRANAMSSYSGQSIFWKVNYENSLDSSLVPVWNKKDLTREDIANIRKKVLEHYLFTGQRTRVYFDKELIADASKTAVMTYLAEDDYRTYEIADKSYLEDFNTPEVLKYLSVPDLFVSNARIFKSEKRISFACREAYVDRYNNKFIPVACEIVEWKQSVQKDEHNNGTVISSVPVNTGVMVNFNIDSSKVPDGYTYLKCENNSCLGTVGGFEGQDSDTDYVIKEDAYNQYDVTICIKTTPMKTNSFDESYQKEITIAIGLIIIASLVFALLPATITYNTKKRNYEIFEYRRKMTDAMAHDLKTPLAAAATYVENLENNIGSDKQSFYVSKLSEKIWQMNKMVNGMLDFSRSENESFTVKKSDVDIGEMIQEILTENEPVLTKHGLKVAYEKNRVTVNTDRELIRQALGNLINNAALYAKEGTEISVTCDSSKIVISNFAASAVENAEAMKQPFAKGSESRENSGTGLGLAIADNNLTMLGYKLGVKSEDGKFVATVTL